MLAAEGVSKRYAGVVALDDVSVSVPGGGCLALVGESGAGKSTLLRCFNRLVDPDAGRITIGGADVRELDPIALRRRTGYVAQEGGLLPHWHVARNVSLVPWLLGDRTAGERAAEALALVGLDPARFDDRRPSQLSGGQRQRVALARALVNRPKVLLLDEPLGALDLKLRQAMQIELKEIQQQVGLTFIYVTHDQEEALTMSDRLAVFSRGRVEQVGTPAEVYERPATGFVAGFVGTSNVLEGDAARTIADDPHAFTIRPEKIAMVEPNAEVPDGAYSATGSVRDVVYLGASTRYIVTLDVGSELVVMQQNLATSSMEALRVRGKAVRLIWDRRNNRPVDAAGGSVDGSADPEEEAS